MSYALTFARHFARLVQMLLLEGNDFEKQLATLRSLVTVSEQGPVKLVLHDMQLISVNAEVVPGRFEGVEDLLAQLIGHSDHRDRVSAEGIARGPAARSKAALGRAVARQRG